MTSPARALACLALPLLLGVAPLVAQSPEREAATDAEAEAAEPRADGLGRAKRRFTLGRPVPRHLMRELATDRPDVTESPNTVDAGHVQLEMDIVNYTRDRAMTGEAGPATTSRVGFAPVMLKLGLRHNVDVHVFVEAYGTQTQRMPSLGRTLHWRGVGDLGLRVKVNLWGNDGGTTALAAMPYVALSRTETPGPRQLAAGLVFPFGAELGGGFEFGAMAQFDVQRLGQGEPYDLSSLFTATVGRTITGGFGAFVELVGTNSLTSRQPYVALANGGVSLQVSRDLKFDGGMAVGLSGAADDLRPFLGLSARY